MKVGGQIPWNVIPICETFKIYYLMGVVDPTKLKQNLRVFWKLMNLRDCVWEIQYRIILRDHIAGKGDNSLQHYKFGS